jgi:hypothetical protein
MGERRHFEMVEICALQAVQTVNSAFRARLQGPQIVLRRVFPPHDARLVDTHASNLELRVPRRRNRWRVKRGKHNAEPEDRDGKPQLPSRVADMHDSAIRVIH